MRRTEQRRSLVTVDLRGDAALKGVDREQPGRLPVRGPVPALTVILQASKFPAASAEPVEQLQHRLIALGVVFAHALPGSVPSLSSVISPTTPPLSPLRSRLLVTPHPRTRRQRASAP